MQIIAAIERARQAKLLRGTCQSASLRTVLRTDRMMLPLHLADTAVQRTAALRGHSKVAHYAILPRARCVQVVVRHGKARDYSGLGQSGEDQGVAGQQGICRGRRKIGNVQPRLCSRRRAAIVPFKYPYEAEGSPTGRASWCDDWFLSQPACCAHISCFGVKVTTK
jgi:hypothetical protein